MASPQLKEHSGTVKQCHILGKLWFHFFWVCGYNKLNKFSEGNLVFANAPSTAYTEHSIHWVQHSPSTAYTKYSNLPNIVCLHSHHYELTSECRFNFHCDSLQTNCHQPAVHESLKCKVNWSHSHGGRSTNWSIESQRLAFLPSTAFISTASTYSSDLALTWPAGAFPNSLIHSLQAHIIVHFLTTSRCNSKPAWLCPPWSLNHSLQVHLQSYSHYLQVYLPVHSMLAPDFIFKFAQSWPTSTTLSSLHHYLHSASLSSLGPHFQVYLKYLSSTTCSQPRLPCVDG